MDQKDSKLSLPQMKAVAVGQIAESLFLSRVEAVSLHEMWKQMVVVERDWSCYAVSLMFHLLPGGVHL